MVNGKTYKIQKGDTLESISKQLKIDIFELRNYHNNQCKLEDLIGKKLPVHLKEILYQSPQDIINQELNQVKEQKSFELALKPDYQPVIYEVKVSFSEDGKENNLRYTLQVQWLQRNLVQIDRTNLYINYEEPNLLADELASLTSSALYPMELYVDSNGRCTGIHNFPEIKRRWREAKPEITKIYKGEYTEKYLTDFETSLFDPDILDKQITKDWFLKAYFSRLYRTYPPEGVKEETQTYFPVIPSISPVEYTVQYGITTLEEEGERLFRIDVEGIVSDERTADDFNNESDFPLSLLNQEEIREKAQGYYQALYFLEPARHIIRSLYLECTLELEKTKKVYVAASRTDLPEESKLIKEEGIIEIVKSDKPEKPKSNFLLD